MMLRCALSVLLLAVAVCPAEMLLVGVGIETYEDPSIQPLHYAIADVNAVAAALRKGSVPEANLRVLTSASEGALRPSSGGIVRALGWARTRARAGDTLVFYFSGHGLVVDGESFLLTAETSVDMVKETALRLSVVNDALAGFQGDHILLVIDACRVQPRKDKSGTAAAMEEQWAKDVRLRSLPPLQSKAQVATLLACDVGQRAFEWPDGGNSVFTYYLVQALQGAKGALAADGTVRVGSLADYLRHEVEAWSERARFPKQTPRLESPGGADFVLYAPPRRQVADNAPTPAGPQPARLRLTTVPPGATVVMDGKEIGRTPLDQSLMLPAGKQESEVQVRLAGHVTHTFRMTLARGITETVNVTLQPVPDPTAAPAPGGKRPDDLVVTGADRKQLLTRGDLSLMAYGNAKAWGVAQGAETERWFSDVPVGSVYYDPVGWLLRAGVINGYPDATFRPERTLTRYEMAMILSRFVAVMLHSLKRAGLDERAANPFADVPFDHWAYDPVAELAALGVFGGNPDGTFKGAATATTANFKEALNRLNVALASRPTAPAP